MYKSILYYRHNIAPTCFGNTKGVTGVTPFETNDYIYVFHGCKHDGIPKCA